MTPLRTVLITNDDGIDAPGLAALATAFAAHDGVEVWICAPDAPRSACGHGMTLDRPVAAERRGERRFAIGGMPADCVYLALFGLLPRRPDVVVSGVNRGPNLGTDVVYSGTVAGAREAVIRRVHGVAASLVAGDDFAAAAASAAAIALAVAALPGPPLLLNLNYPGGVFAGPVLAPLGGRAYPEETTRRGGASESRAEYLLGGPPVRDRQVPGSDGWLIANGSASATLLGVDQTDRDALAAAGPGLPVADFLSARRP